MNPASRLYDFALHLRKQQETTKLIDAYKTYIEDDSDYAAWHAMCALQDEAQKLQNHTMQWGDEYKELYDALDAILYPNGVKTVQISHIQTSVETVRLMLTALKDTLDNTYLYEQDVSDRIDALKESLEYFIETLDGLPSDPYVARMYVRVSLKLKEALEMYRITGIDGVREALAAFDCVFDDNIKGKTSLTDKVKATVDAAKAAKEVTAIATDLLKLL